VSDNCAFLTCFGPIYVFMFVIDFDFCCCCTVYVGLCYVNVDQQPRRSPSVIVIGGGMAGIAAARALHDASFQVFKQMIYIADYFILLNIQFAKSYMQ